MIGNNRAPLARVFDEDLNLVIDGVTRFTYVFSEKADDASYLTIETNDPNLPDHPSMQEGKVLILVWGYIGAKEFQKRKVYIWDLKVGYLDTGIRIEVVAYPKAAYLKLNSSKDVFNDIDVKELGQKYADAYGLNLITEGVDPNEESQLPAEYYETTSFGGTTEQKLDLRSSNPTYTIARDKTAVPLKIPLKKIKTVPQANSSDKKTLEQAVALEPVDNLFFQGRDDDMILKKRNFNQTPYRSYIYKAEPGYLLSFTPATKSSENKKNAIANTVNGWIEEDKEYLQAEITRSQSGAGLLGDVVEQSLGEQVLRKLEEDGQLASQLDGTVGVDGFAKLQYAGVDENGQEVRKLVVTEQLPETGTSVAMWHKRGVVDDKLVFTPKGSFISAAKDVTGRINTKGLVVFEPKEYLPTVETTPKDVAGVGINRQSQKEVDLNESTAEFLGDPTFIDGKVISINGVSNRYSGNYYVFKASHEITPEGGYKIYASLYRTGPNELGDETSNKVNGSKLGFIKNVKAVTPGDENQSLKALPIIED
jgi:hypothetical protein